jgi:hypothetical protein
MKRAILGFLTVTAISCGSPPAAPTLPTFPVSGVVYLNQKALVRGLVVFHPVKPPAGTNFRCYAHTGADGSFSLSTFAPNDGAPTGRYRVTILMQDEDDGPVRIPLRYRNPNTSGILVEIKPEPTSLPPFQLRSP